MVTDKPNIYLLQIIHQLEELPSIEVGPTALALFMTLTFNALRAIVMTYLQCKSSKSTVSRFRRQSGHKQTDGLTDGQTDGQTDGRKRSRYLPR